MAYPFEGGSGTAAINDLRSCGASGIAACNLARYASGCGGLDKALSTNFLHRGTLGQCDAGAMQGAGRVLLLGFWLPAGYMPTVHVGDPEAESIPHEFALRQNYPNPFNPGTVITYDLATVADVKLTVLDILGREVATLVNEREAAGPHTVRFDASHLASGVYVYRLVAGNFMAIRKCILLR